ncbi:MAG: hypothetical protein U5R06_06690 [candidate division KSB1 bacterium]|nr:hypothetical protein [candidate division KSB1 bacterium]
MSYMENVNQILSKWNQSDLAKTPSILYRTALHFFLDISQSKRALFLVREQSHFTCTAGLEHDTTSLTRQHISDLNKSLKSDGFDLRGHEISKITQSPGWALITLGKPNYGIMGVICLQNPEKDLRAFDVQNTIDILKNSLVAHLCLIQERRKRRELEMEKADGMFINTDYRQWSRPGL